MVGAPRFELGTSCTQNMRATRLRHAPTEGIDTPADRTGKPAYRTCDEIFLRISGSSSQTGAEKRVFDQVTSANIAAICLATGKLKHRDHRHAR